MYSRATLQLFSCKWHNRSQWYHIQSYRAEQGKESAPYQIHIFLSNEFLSSLYRPRQYYFILCLIILRNKIRVICTLLSREQFVHIFFTFHTAEQLKQAVYLNVCLYVCLPCVCGQPLRTSVCAFHCNTSALWAIQLYFSVLYEREMTIGYSKLSNTLCKQNGGHSKSALERFWT